MASAITGTPYLSGSPTAYSGANSSLAPAIQTIWSKEILFQSMPILRFEQFAVKKTELGVQPGLQINFMRYNNLGSGHAARRGCAPADERPHGRQFSITVAEHGYAVAVSELLLNASPSTTSWPRPRVCSAATWPSTWTARRATPCCSAPRCIYGYDNTPGTITSRSPYDSGAPATSRAGLTGNFNFIDRSGQGRGRDPRHQERPAPGRDLRRVHHPHQSRSLRDNPEFIEVTKYAAPGNFMLGEIGRLYDCVFIETTQIKQVLGGAGGTTPVYQSVFIGDNAFGHAITLPVELRDGGILDFGREHALAWYAIWGLGSITDQAIVLAETN